jgi:hypothetical protein
LIHIINTKRITNESRQDEERNMNEAATATTTTRTRAPTAALKGRPYAWVALFVVLVSLLIPQDDASSSSSSILPTASNESLSLERGKALGSTITAADLHQAYRDIQEEYHAKAFGSKHWVSLNNKKGVEVSLLKHFSDPNCPYVKMTAIMPVAPQDCWNFLSLANWDKTMPHMDPFYEGVSILPDLYEHKGVAMMLARKRTKRLLAFGKRDFFFVSVADVPKRDGTLVSGTVSVVAPHIVPRHEGYTRAFQDSIAFYEPLDNGSKTQLTIICRIDLNDSGSDGAGGFMPMWLYVKTIGATGARSVLSMRDYLEEQLALAKAAAAAKEEEEKQEVEAKRKFLSFLPRRRSKGSM